MTVHVGIVGDVASLIAASDGVSLDLSEFPLGDSETIQRTLRMIALQMPQLTSLRVAIEEPFVDVNLEIFLMCAQDLTLETGRLLSQLEWLRLGHTGLRDDGLSCVAAAVQAGNLPQLQWLDLSFTHVGDESLKLMAAAAQVGHLSRLERLDLPFTRVGNEGVKLLAAAAQSGHLAQLHRLNLCSTQVGDDSVRALAVAVQTGHLSQLEWLDVSGTDVADESLKILASAADAGQLGQLRCLDLSRTAVGDKTAKVLADVANSGHLAQLQFLNLSSSKVGDESMKLLAEAALAGNLPKLIELNLMFTQVGDDSAKMLAAAAQSGHLAQLQSLNLSWTNVGDEGVKSLAAAAQSGHLTELQRLGLSRAKVGDETGIALAKAALAGHLPKVIELNLMSTQVGDGSAKLLAAAAQAGHLSQLKKLDLSQTQVGDGSAKLLAAAAQAGHFAQLQELGLSFTKVGDESMKLLAAAAQAGHLTQLESLELIHTAVSDETLMVLADAALAGHVTKLKYLMLQGARIKCVDEAILNPGEAWPILDTVLRGIVLPEVRVILLGSEAVGKSWLRRRLFLDEIVCRKESRSETHDIDLVHPRQSVWKPQVIVDGQPQTIEPRVWDFAGQLITHGIHEAFLANDGRSICILVLDAKRVPNSLREHGQELGNRLQYWLRTISHFAGNEVPVVIAVTQCDDVELHDRPIDRPISQLGIPISQAVPDDLTTAFGAWVVGLVDNCSACDSRSPIEPLRQAIEAAINQLNVLKGSKVPSKLILLRRKVEAELRRLPFASHALFAQWCVSDGVEIADANESDWYLRILHHMGSLFYFGLTDYERRERDRVGSDWLQRFPPGRQRIIKKELGLLLTGYVINPDWLKSSVYRLIRLSRERAWISRDMITDQVAESDRQMREVDKDFVWDELGTAIVEEFLKLADLSFYDEDNGEYLFPRGLAAGPPPGTDKWEKGQLHWEYFPEAALHRFIVRMHARGEVVCEEGSDGHWRDAVLIEHPKGIRAAIVGKPDEGILEIRFDPMCSVGRREETWTYVKDLFANEFIGLEPQRESGAPISKSVTKTRSANSSANVYLSTLESEERDAWRIQRVQKFAEEILGPLSDEDRAFVRSLFSLTRGKEFRETGRIGFRAGCFFHRYLNEAMAILKIREKWTWDEIFNFLNKKCHESHVLRWDWFGDSDFKPTDSKNMERNYTRSPKPLRRTLDDLIPHLRRGRGPSSPGDC